MAFQLSRRQFGATLLGAAAAFAVPSMDLFAAPLLAKPQTTSYEPTIEDKKLASRLESILARKVERDFSPRSSVLLTDLLWQGSLPVYPAATCDGKRSVVLLAEGPESERTYTVLPVGGEKILAIPYQMSIEAKVPCRISFLHGSRTNAELEKALEPTVDFYRQHENEMLINLLDAVSIPVISNETKFTKRLNDGFRAIEVKDAVVHNLLCTKEMSKRLEKVVDEVDNRHFCYTADVQRLEHPKLRNRIYMTGRPDLVGDFAIRQSMTVLPLAKNYFITFCDIAWAVKPGYVYHVDL